MAGDSTALVAQLDALGEELGAFSHERKKPRRGKDPDIGASEDSETMRLVERGEVLEVESGLWAAQGTSQRRGSKPADLDRKVVWERKLAKLERSKITEWLEALDRRLTPRQGLRRWNDGGLIPVNRPSGNGRTLLYIHGTFACSENILSGIGRNVDGEAFLGWIKRQYTEVLTFDHPTLAVSPMLNARALALLFRDSQAQVDVICHSRGGLVTRWWLEVFDRRPSNCRRAVFVGSPLAGTGLAAPPNIKKSLGLLSNIARALGAGGAGLPFLTVLAGVLRVLGSVTKTIAATPAIDGAVALIPGIAAQSRVGNAAELLSLRSDPVEWKNRYFAVRANFESEQPGWFFWRIFRKPMEYIKDAAADYVFAGENDLVVDSDSMSDLSDEVRIEGSKNVYDFKTTSRVHHTNYFEQRETLAFIQSRLS